MIRDSVSRKTYLIPLRVARCSATVGAPGSTPGCWNIPTRTGPKSIGSPRRRMRFYRKKTMGRVAVSGSSIRSAWAGSPLEGDFAAVEPPFFRVRVGQPIDGLAGRLRAGGAAKTFLNICPLGRPGRFGLSGDEQ